MAHVFVPVDILKQFMLQAFSKSGVPEEDARIVTDVLISSDLRGIESHGVGRLKMYLDRIKDKVQFPVTKFEIIREAPGTALVNGNHGMGHVIAYKAMELAIKKAKKVGIGAVAVKNGTHFGIAGYYANMAIKNDMIGFIVTNSRPSVAPTFGSQPMFGTNPIAFGAPTDEECPFLLDMGTPIVQRGKIEVYNREEKELPPGWAMDSQGNDVRDPAELMQLLLKKDASLLPLGGKGEVTSGYKGYGLAVMVEILSSSLAAGPALLALSGFDEDGNKTHHYLGHFF
ncbi:MAG: Ldh family oxidoreductase, partial [Vulcanimicrobiota bacterium]